MKILILGGSKSGKSSTGQELCRRLAQGPLIYWATMEPCDSEDEARIVRHIEDRDGMGFETIEKGRNIRDAQVPADSTIMFDAVTALLANEMFGKGCVDRDVGLRVMEDLADLSGRCSNIICVCDEIWRDGTVYDETTELYRRELALVCRKLAESFDVVGEVCCGIVKCYKGSLNEILD